MVRCNCSFHKYCQVAPELELHIFFFFLKGQFSWLYAQSHGIGYPR